jgi:hypothetical protein
MESGASLTPVFFCQAFFLAVCGELSEIPRFSSSTPFGTVAAIALIRLISGWSRSAALFGVYFVS